MVDLAKCWVCGAHKWRPFKESTLNGRISSEDFKITDAKYGRTGRIDECQLCGFRQVVDVDSVLSFYESLEDVAYDQGREQCGLQARKIVESVLPYKKSGRLLDIGAASGILLEQAAKLGFDGEGVEPSRSLAKVAQDSGFKVHLGVFPHAAVKAPYDVIALIDVIEHVPSPIQLLRDIGAHLAPDGIGVLTTPDVRSLAAKLLGARWWHYRVAHIGYFDKKTLKKALDEAGLQCVEMNSPAWYFTCEYAWDRAMVYVPEAFRIKMPRSLRKKTIRVNFRDSMQVIFRRKQ